MKSNIQHLINNPKNALGIELGSTRIKAVLLDSGRNILASASHEWENKYENNIWTYKEEDIIKGIQTCYKTLKDDIKREYNIILHTIGAVGVSAMMHGYLVFNKRGRLLTPFRTWRNNNAESAAKKLSEIFKFNIPARWSIAHLYQAISDNEGHIGEINFITKLSGYIHYLLSGVKVLGTGDASGVFPLQNQGTEYNQRMLDIFDGLIKGKVPWKLRDILPDIKPAGENAGSLTLKGARFLDEDGGGIWSRGLYYVRPRVTQAQAWLPQTV